MGIEITNKAKIDLPNLAIEVVEELERTRKGMRTDLKSTKGLSELIKNHADSIKKDPHTRLDYSLIFSDAYYSTYSVRISKPTGKNLIQYIEPISEKLDSPSDLKDEEIKKLIEFCTAISDYAALHKEEVDNLKRPHF